jgi:hypothetical protein
MSQIDFASMTDRDLKQYIMTHPHDQAAFHSYIDRREARAEEFTILEPDDPDLGSKFVMAVQRQIDRSATHNHDATA